MPYETLYLEGYMAPMPEVAELETIADVLSGVPLKRHGSDGKIYYVYMAFSATWV